jgi:hypothetical protein
LVASTDYHTLGIGTGLCFLAAAITYATLPATPQVPALERTKPLPAWRDVTFLRVALVNGVFWLAALVLEYGLPVYLVQSLELPSWIVGGFFAINTVMVTVLQLPIGRRLQQLDQARAVVVGGLLYVGASLILASAAPLGNGLRLGGVLMVALVWTLGELITGQCVTVLLTRLAPPDRRGGYLAFNQMFVGIATAFAPLLVTIALLASAPLLWWSLAAVVVCAVVLVPRHRELPVSQPIP